MSFVTRLVPTALVLVFALAAPLVACDSNRSSEEAGGGQSATPTAPAAPADLPMVEVSAEGTTFDPPVQPAQIPDGAWYCDMGTVHYASMSQGDGRCPLCHMHLVHKGAEGSGMGHPE